MARVFAGPGRDKRGRIGAQPGEIGGGSAPSKSAGKLQMRDGLGVAVCFGVFADGGRGTEGSRVAVAPDWG